jgi:hypothetical protein
MMKSSSAPVFAVLASVVGSIVLVCACGEDNATSSSSSSGSSGGSSGSSGGGTSGAAPSVDTPQARETTICEAQQSFDKKCGVDGGSVCKLSCFAPFLSPAAATAFRNCTVNKACNGGVECGLGVPCNDAELCGVQAGKAGISESGVDVNAVIAKCIARRNECQLEMECWDPDRFASHYGPFTGVPEAIAACFDKPCGEIRECRVVANKEANECIASM